jgi:hypothetical protein
MRVRASGALLAAVMLTAGCAAAVGGTAQPAPSLKPRSLSRQTVDHVLLGDTALSRIIKQPFDIDPRFPPRFGGAEQLRDTGTALPDACLGVAAMLQQNVYPSRDIQEVAAETLRHATASAEMTSVKEGVVSLPTAADANALFATFAQQWQKCDGATAALPGGMFRLKGRITHVQVSTSVLAATVSIGWTTSKSEPGPESDAIHAQRAIGVRGNCLVEVEVDFFNPPKPSAHGAGDPPDFGNSAPDIASAMMEKVDALI